MTSVESMLAEANQRAQSLAKFQCYLNGLATPADRKREIIDAHCAGLLSQTDTTLLIQAYMLETA